MANFSDKPRIPSHYRSQVGSNIRRLREAAGLSQRALATLAGLRPDRLSKYEAGAQPPPIFTLSRLAHVIGRPVELFLPEVRFEHEGNRLFDEQVRRAWLQPVEVRDSLGQMLRFLLNVIEQRQNEQTVSPSGREACHASRR